MAATACARAVVKQALTSAFGEVCLVIACWCMRESLIVRWHITIWVGGDGINHIVVFAKRRLLDIGQTCVTENIVTCGELLWIGVCNRLVVSVENL